MLSDTHTDQTFNTKTDRSGIESGTVFTSGDRYLLMLVGLFLFCVLVATLREAVRNPLWMDEVLAVWVARMPSAAAIRSAIAHGSEFSPPTYHLLLHYLARLAGNTYLVYRLPSVLAHLVTGICVFTLLRRYLETASAAFGMAFALLGYLSMYALQARPYALLVACFALATLLWDDLDRNGVKSWRIVVIAFLLAFAASLHFYAALFVVCIASMEGVWSVLNGRIRPAVWIGFFLAGLSSLAWLPLLKTLSRFNAGDTTAPNYYAKPTSGALTYVYSTLFVFDRQHVLLLLIAIALVALVYALAGLGTRIPFRPADPPSPVGQRLTNLYIIGFCEIAFPILVFVVARFVTRTFNARYCLLGCLGFSILIACVLRSLSASRPMAALVLLAACRLAFVDIPTWSEDEAYLEPLFAKANQSYPIVIGEGLEFLQLEESAPPSSKARFVYVTAPPGVVSPDPTNENQVKRWIPIRPDLPIVDAPTFFSRNQRFYILHTGASTDVLTGWLMRNGLLGKVIAHDGGTWLFEAKSPEPELK